MRLNVHISVTTTKNSLVSLLKKSKKLTIFFVSTKYYLKKAFQKINEFIQ